MMIKDSFHLDMVLLCILPDVQAAARAAGEGHASAGSPVKSVGSPAIKALQLHSAINYYKLFKAWKIARLCMVMIGFPAKTFQSF